VIHGLTGGSDPREAGRRSLVIVNADDYGLTMGVNRAIVDAHLAGIVTSTTVLVSGEAAGDAAELPSSMSVGLHVNLTLGRPTSDASRIPTLVGPEGRFHSRAALVRLLLRRRVSSEDVYREATAQIDALHRLGVTPTHWDTHLHVAEIPQLARAIGAAAKNARILYARTPQIWIVNGTATGSLARWRWRTSNPTRLAGELARAVSHRILARDFLMPDYRCAANGVVAPAVTYAERWNIALAHLPRGTCEISIHPGRIDERLTELTPNLTIEREVDLAVAMSPHVRKLLADGNAALIPFTRLGDTR
jgi:chitin disaccharide deacetylase